MLLLVRSKCQQIVATNRTLYFICLTTKLLWQSLNQEPRLLNITLMFFSRMQSCWSSVGSGKTISIQTKLAASFQQLHSNKTKVDKQFHVFFFLYASCDFLQPISSF